MNWTNRASWSSPVTSAPSLLPHMFVHTQVCNALCQTTLYSMYPNNVLSGMINYTPCAMLKKFNVSAGYAVYRRNASLQCICQIND
jgi:hypothetical protein